MRLNLPLQKNIATGEEKYFVGIRKKMEEQILSTLVPKLGLKGDKIIKKANEYMRLADIRGSGSSLASLSLSGSCKAVMCLELAAVTYGDHVDKVTAMKVSGMKNKKMYTSGLRALEALLDLQSKVTITDLTVQFGCPGAKQLTMQVLKRYDEERATQNDVECSQILFNGAALYAVCRRQKQKIDKTKMIDLMGVKRSMFDKVVAHMDKIAEALTKEQKLVEKSANKRSKSFIDQIEKSAREHSPSKKTRQMEAQDGDEEPFETWKHRILTQAYSALGQTYTPKS